MFVIGGVDIVVVVFDGLDYVVVFVLYEGFVCFEGVGFF